MSKIIDTIVELAVGYFNNYRGKFNLLKKKIMTFDRTPPPLPIFFRKYKVSVCQLATGMYYVVSPIKKATKNVVLYLHGGAFIFPITKYHYEFLDRIIGETNATFYIALYPISHPNYSSFDDTYTFLNELFLKIKDRHAKDTVNIMGDSSGACLVLSFAQYVKIHYKYKFTNVIAISPCPRFDYGQDEMISYSKLDPILNDGLLTGAYLWYLADHNPLNYQISAYYGNSHDIGKITLFVGEREIFIYPTYEYHKKLLKEKIEHNFYVGTDMIHDYVILSNFAESKKAFLKIKKILTNDK